MTPNEYLTACRQKLGIKSDYELARRIGWTNGAICDVRKEKPRAIPADVAYRIADALGLDHGVVWADIEAHQEKDPKKRAYWEEFLGRAAMVLCGTGLLAVTSIVTPSPAQAAVHHQTPHQVSVLCSIRNAAKRVINRAVAALNMRATGTLRFGFSG